MDNGSVAAEIGVSRDSLEDFVANRIIKPRQPTLEKYEEFVKQHLPHKK